MMCTFIGWNMVMVIVWHDIDNTQSLVLLIKALISLPPWIMKLDSLVVRLLGSQLNVDLIHGRHTFRQHLWQDGHSGLQSVWYTALGQTAHPYCSTSVTQPSNHHGTIKRASAFRLNNNNTLCLKSTPDIFSCKLSTHFTIWIIFDTNIT